MLYSSSIEPKKLLVWYKKRKGKTENIKGALQSYLLEEDELSAENIQLLIDQYTNLSAKKGMRVSVTVGIGFSAVFMIASTYLLFSDYFPEQRNSLLVLTFILGAISLGYAFYLLGSRSFHAEWDIVDLLIDIKRDTNALSNISKPSADGDPFLELDLLDEFLTMLDTSNIFLYDFKTLGDLFYASFDRLKTCINYLNKHSSYPTCEEQLIIFVMFASMLRDVIKEMVVQTGGKSTYNKMVDDIGRNKYFKTTYERSALYSSEKDEPSDDAFWEYLRSVVFAHPAGTDRPKFFQNGEIQYSPWVSVSPSLASYFESDDLVGVHVYSSTREDSLFIRFSFDTLKSYIVSRYGMLENVTEWGWKKISEIENVWRNQRVDEKEPIEVYQQFSKVLEERHVSHFDVDEIIKYLSCDMTFEDNEPNVKELRTALCAIIPSLKEALYELDHERFSNIIGDTIRCYPDDLHQMAYYQLEKIYTYLDDEHPGDVEWGLTQADNFYRSFAKKWVKIDVKIMSFTEIRLLVSTACFLEHKQQILECNDPS